MKSFLAFFKKEMLEQVRSGRLMLLVILFILFGIMNPAIAKLTPWLLESMADSLAQNGMVVTGVTVSALDSWVQFFKNAPMGLIAFILLESNLFVKEYQSGTLIGVLTKGLERYKVLLSKTLVLVILWIGVYGLFLGITYAYNDYFWDNAVAENLWFAVGSWWLFGMWIIALCVLFSAITNSSAGVLGGIAGTVGLSYLLSLIPKWKEYLPTQLVDGTPLIYGMAEAEKYWKAVGITAVLLVVCFTISIPIFNKKHL